jgi:hypothetical protein
MKRISEANPEDFDYMLDSIERLDGFDSAQELAQAMVGICYERFQKSLVLLRLFLTAPYSALPAHDRQLVDEKTKVSETFDLLRAGTPVLTLMGTRGWAPAWNERDKSRGFRCIPLVSSKYVASLSMLAMQFRNMNFDFESFDGWDASMAGAEQTGKYSGMLYVRDAAVDRDDLGRMVVPRQEFVAEYGVKTALGFGAKYPNYPAMGILFTFTDEILTRSEAEPFARLLEAYLSHSEKLVGNGAIFSEPTRALLRV